MKPVVIISCFMSFVLLLNVGCSPNNDEADSTGVTGQSAQSSSHDDNSATSSKPSMDSLPTASESVESAKQFAAANNIPSENLMDFSAISASSGEHRYGIDVSHHQDVINWQAVADTGVHFAYIKATEGIDYEDPRFRSNWQAAKQAGIHRGAYHMFRPEDTAIEQLENFVLTLKQAGLDADMLPPVLDVEMVHTMNDVNHAVMHERIIEWLIGVEKELGVKPVIYTNPTFWKDYLSDDSALLDYPLWISEYDLEAQQPSSTGGWSTYALWQFSRYGIVPGVSKTVDLSRANPGVFEY